MNESYAETSVKKKASPVNYLIKALMIALVVLILLLGSPLFGAFTAIVVMLAVGACVLVFPYLDVEYEYVFCDGQLDFDKIYGGNRRKTAMRIDFENVEMMAPVTSHQLDSYNHAQTKTVNYTSGEKERKVYVAILRQGEVLTRILFEPNEKMIAAIKQKAPRKISEY